MDKKILGALCAIVKKKVSFATETDFANKAYAWNRKQKRKKRQAERQANTLRQRVGKPTSSPLSHRRSVLEQKMFTEWLKNERKVRPQGRGDTVQPQNHERRTGGLTQVKVS